MDRFEAAIVKRSTLKISNPKSRRPEVVIATRVDGYCRHTCRWINPRCQTHRLDSHRRIIALGKNPTNINSFNFQFEFPNDTNSPIGTTAPRNMAAVHDLAERVKPAPIYIDTDTGADDESATGGENSPYKSLAYAYIQNGGGDGKTYLSRSSTTGPVSEDGDPAQRLVWKEPAKSAVKKAQGALDAHKKKILKQQQVAAQEEEKEKTRLKHLEEAKKVILTEDASLPAAIKIKIGEKDLELGQGDKKGTRVKVSGGSGSRSRPHSSRWLMGTATCSASLPVTSPRPTMP
jgi:hypothetical protein